MPLGVQTQHTGSITSMKMSCDHTKAIKTLAPMGTVRTDRHVTALNIRKHTKTGYNTLRNHQRKIKRRLIFNRFHAISFIYICVAEGLLLVCQCLLIMTS